LPAVAVAQVERKPSGAAADVYSSSLAPAFATDRFAEQIAAALGERRGRSGDVPMLRDGRLDRVAYDIARNTGTCHVPAADVITFLRWHYGVVEPETNLFVACGGDGNETSDLAALKSRWVGASDLSRWRRMGVGVAREAGMWRAAIIFQEKNLDLEPVPRRLALGGRVVIAGRIREVFHSPVVLVTPPRGAVGELVTECKKDHFSAQLGCDSGRGVYQIEISAYEQSGAHVLAIFPVYCGIEPPISFVPVEAALSTKQSAPEAERAVLELLDRDRRAAGLTVLVRDGRLAAVARRYSHEMAETGEVAHISPRSGSPGDRIDAAGLHPRPVTVAENVCSAASAVDAENGFMASPGHRNNILNAEVTHVGVGVALGRDEGGTQTLFVTQIFAGWHQ
jgi:uncharacterized protein YkwD